jgi:hypothetical protein
MPPSCSPGGTAVIYRDDSTTIRVFGHGARDDAEGATAAAHSETDS